MNRTSKRTASNRPFFTRFLEEQKLERVIGGGRETQKFPSDGDEEVALGGPIGGEPPDKQTQKFPSDGDDDLPPL